MEQLILLLSFLKMEYSESVREVGVKLDAEKRAAKSKLGTAISFRGVADDLLDLDVLGRVWTGMDVGNAMGTAPKHHRAVAVLLSLLTASECER